MYGLRLDRIVGCLLRLKGDGRLSLGRTCRLLGSSKEEAAGLLHSVGLGHEIAEDGLWVEGLGAADVAKFGGLRGVLELTDPAEDTRKQGKMKASVEGDQLESLLVGWGLKEETWALAFSGRKQLNHCWSRPGGEGVELEAGKEQAESTMERLRFGALTEEARGGGFRWQGIGEERGESVGGSGMERLSRWDLRGDDDAEQLWWGEWADEEREMRGKRQRRRGDG